MKQFFLSLLAMMLATFLAAQAPQAINYQAIARDHAGNPIANTTVGVQFRILQGEASDRLAYTETFTTTTNQYGLFNLQIGRGAPVSGAFSGINWANQPCFLEVAIDPKGDKNYQLVGTSEMLSVPYALKAGNVESERQVLTLEGNQLSISQGNTVTFSQVECEIEIADCATGGSDTKVRVGEPSNDDMVHMDLGPNSGAGGMVTDALVLRKNTNGNTMLELRDVMGGHNTFVGKDAGSANTTNGSDGIFNTALGSEALKNNTTGLQNTATGTGSLRNNSIGRDNTALGTEALKLNISGNSNTAVGALSLQNNDFGNHNTAVGYRSLHYSRGTANTAFGAEALYSNLYNSRITAIGFRAMTRSDNNTITPPYQAYNTAVGYEALAGSTNPTNNTGTSNTAIGDQALWSNESGANNTAIGRDALANNTTGNANVANGVTVLLANTTGSENTANGFDALRSNKTGSYNAAYGKGALDSNIDGNYNTANGTGALSSNDHGGDNTASGAQALSSNTTGSFNTAIGENALITNITGSNNTALGHRADVSANNLTNATAIGANAKVTTSDAMILGDNAVKVGIGLSGDPAGPTNSLEIDENKNLPFIPFAQGTSGLTFRNLRSTSLATLPLPLSPLTPQKVLSVDANGVVVLGELTGGGGAVEWAFLGNAIGGNDFLGTTNTQPLRFKVNQAKAGIIDMGGQTFFGFEAGLNNISQTNTGTGFKALRSNTSGKQNTANGWGALSANITGFSNTAIGYNALTLNKANDNTAIGAFALTTNAGNVSTGIRNTATGSSALSLNAVGSRNTANGAFALQKNTASDNTAIGSSALQNNVAGTNNTANGSSALLANVGGNNNTAVGKSTLQANIASSDNTAIGFEALKANIGGSENTATGTKAMEKNVNGFGNTANGTRALNANIGGTLNTATGTNALLSNIGGTQNCAVGVNALNTNTAGSFNTSTGVSSLFYNVDGNSNTAYGFFALAKNDYLNGGNGGNDNTGIGKNALVNNQGGNSNTAVGAEALQNNVGGFRNTALGYLAGMPLAQPNLTNTTAIGYNATVTASNQMRLGDGFVTEVLPGSQCLASLGNNAYKWKEVWACNGVIQTSDSRLKTKISKIDYGLNVVMSLRPVQYYWKEQFGDKRMVGFIAQEVENLVPEAVIVPKNETEYYAMKYDALIPVLTKAIQEQQVQIEALKLQNAQLNALAQQSQSLQTQLDAIRAEMLSFRATIGQQSAELQVSDKK